MNVSNVLVAIHTITHGYVAIGHITAEAMDSSKLSFLPASSTKQVLEELKSNCGPFDQTLLQKLQSTVTARDSVKNKGFDDLVCQNYVIHIVQKPNNFFKRTFAFEATQNAGLHVSIFRGSCLHKC